MEIKIDEGKILTEILERDGDLHERIKDKVRQRLVDECVKQVESKFMTERWNGDKEIWDAVLEKVTEKQEEIVREILKNFYDSYRYGKKDITILKKLKEILNES